ncbi:metallophosphoesterase [Halovulum dunhuangense]|uniref:Metallophosphoesterase n=2 Tax=Halovulum dunhuangense TaxID=1505036 RepID=A0A849L192_9RHOB|nr:metallophosphoesterase [Halovulum dunhuangense]
MADKLVHRLTALGYTESKGAWRHADPDRSVVFLGDFIDRGPQNGRVLSIVRAMIEAGTARAIMGNHELNAIHFHSQGDRGPLRDHTPDNRRQHESFLAEFPLGSPGARAWIDWMADLPIWLERDGLRFVHACWDEGAISLLRTHAPNGSAGMDTLLRAATDPPLRHAVEMLTKGPEVPLPQGYSFKDKGQRTRTDMRLRWWLRDATAWRSLGISVPHREQLPEGDIPARHRMPGYPADAPPVFFGHYWLEDAPELQAPNVLCLDYCAGKEGPLVSYPVVPGARRLELARLQGLDPC